VWDFDPLGLLFFLPMLLEDLTILIGVRIYDKQATRPNLLTTKSVSAAVRLQEPHAGACEKGDPKKGYDALITNSPYH